MPITRNPNSPFYYYDFYFANKRFRGSTKEKDRSAAMRFEKAYKASLTGMTFTKSRIVTVGDLLNEYEAYLKQTFALAKSSLRYYHTGLRILRASQIVKCSVQALRAPAVSCCKIGNSSATRNNGLRTLSCALSLGRQLGVCNTNFPIKLARTPIRHRIFSASEELRLLEHAKQPLRDIFVMMMNTGARPAELFGLRWTNVDTDAGVIFIADGKTERARRQIALTTAAMAVLNRRAQMCESPTWVFPSKKKMKTPLTTVQKQFIEARNSAGLPRDLLLYSCRHTYATRLMERSGDMTLVSAQLGHSSCVQSERYIHPRTLRAASLMEVQQFPSPTDQGSRGERIVLSGA